MYHLNGILWLHKALGHLIFMLIQALCRQIHLNVKGAIDLWAFCLKMKAQSIYLKVHRNLVEQVQVNVMKAVK